MQLSIIITSYKSPELLKVCIDSVKKELTLTDYEILVADGKTEEKTILMMREDYPNIKFLPFPEDDGFGFLVKNLAAFTPHQPKTLTLLRKSSETMVTRQYIAAYTGPASVSFT